MRLTLRPAKRAVAETVAIAAQSLHALLMLILPRAKPKQDESS